MNKVREIKIVFIAFFIGSVLILSSSMWLPMFLDNKTTIDLIKEDLTLKEDEVLLEVIENYSDIAAPVEQDNYKEKFKLYSSDKEKKETYAKFLNEIIVKFTSYRDSETNKDKIVLYKNIVNELIKKFDFVVTLKEVPTMYQETSKTISADADNHDDSQIDQSAELPDNLKEE